MDNFRSSSLCTWYQNCWYCSPPHQSSPYFASDVSGITSIGLYCHSSRRTKENLTCTQAQDVAILDVQPDLPRGETKTSKLKGQNSARRSSCSYGRLSGGIPRHRCPPCHSVSTSADICSEKWFDLDGIRITVLVAKVKFRKQGHLKVRNLL